MKYRLTDEIIINYDGTVLRRIECVKSFLNVKAGDKGGWVQNEKNLSQSGDAWVYDDARVYGSARVYDNVQVYGHAEIYGYANVYGYAQVYGYA